MEKKLKKTELKKKVEVKKKDNTFTVSFAPSDSLVRPIVININLGGEKELKGKK